METSKSPHMLEKKKSKAIKRNNGLQDSWKGFQYSLSDSAFNKVKERIEAMWNHEQGSVDFAKRKSPVEEVKRGGSTIRPRIPATRRNAQVTVDDTHIPSKTSPLSDFDNVGLW